MAMTSSYDRQTENSPNPLVRFAQRNRYSLAQELIMTLAPQGSVILDYGSGDGRLLERLSRCGRSYVLWGLEPYPTHYPARPGSDAGFGVVQTAADLPHDRFNLIGCFEVLEHLRQRDIEQFIDYCHAHLDDRGNIIVSVPVMLGPVLFLKSLNAKYIKRTNWAYSFREAIAAGIFLKNTERNPDTRTYLDHKGFDFRILRGMLLAHFRLERELYSPFPRLWWGFNSQWFGVFRQRSMRSAEAEQIATHAALPTERD
jgi:2-polyprenyl-3-methyl-5-hydroxy-6-metoxy-1,4-benzoquinol methylase